MDIKKLTFCFSSILLSACTVNGSYKSQEKQYFENFALSICLGSAFSSDESKSDFNKSASGFMERGNVPIEAYEELRSVVDVWLAKDFPSKHGGQVQSAKCIALYNSTELSELFKKYDPCESKKLWLDSSEYTHSCGSVNGK